MQRRLFCSFLVISVLGGTFLGGCRSGKPAGPIREADWWRGTPPSAGVEALSFLGEPLVRPVLDLEQQQRLEAELAAARLVHEANPEDEEALIWLGRRTAYLGRYREAVSIYSQGLALHPRSARLYRHRGHRAITLRRLETAIADLGRAAELVQGVPDQVEPDGLPNAAGIPTGTSHSNIWYHLGLAYYLAGDLDNAYRCYRECLDRFAGYSDDMLVATAYWLVMTCQRLGRDDEADRVLDSIPEDMEILENFAYRDLLLVYRGDIAPEVLWKPDELSGTERATIGYGIGNYCLIRGNRERARGIFCDVLASASWAAFGFIASEAELARMGDGRSGRLTPPASLPCLDPAGPVRPIVRRAFP
jgi:tetratricopeptide (TPR) repeat protein